MQPSDHSPDASPVTPAASVSNDAAAPVELSLADFHAGDMVRYVPYHAHGDIRHADCENGRVTSKNDTYVFVRFHSETSQACKPDQLRKFT